MTTTINSNQKNNKGVFILIGTLSVVVPLLVSLMYYFAKDYQGLDTSFLPRLNAFINSGTAICLLFGFVMIKKGKKELHRTFMVSAFVLSSLFLISYVIYHSTSESTHFGGEGLIRYVYFILLISHIILAAVIVPFVLLTIYFGWSKQLEKHKKIAKWTFPMWLYVSVTGVIVYLMISPYYL